MRTWAIIGLSLLALQACGQQKAEQQTHAKTINSEYKMDLSIITNENVRSAVQSLQDNNINNWYSHFTDDAVFTDDGRSLDFRKFFDNAFDKKEKFLEIDSVENNGKSIYGNFYAGQWGTFRVYFKFHENANGKFNRLDIGQASR